MRYTYRQKTYHDTISVNHCSSTLDAVCYHVTSTEMLCYYSPVKLTTDSYQFLVPLSFLNLPSTMSFNFRYIPGRLCCPYCCFWNWWVWSWYLQEWSNQRACSSCLHLGSQTDDHWCKQDWQHRAPIQWGKYTSTSVEIKGLPHRRHKIVSLSIAPDKAAYCVFTQFRGPENAIKFISVRTKTQLKSLILNSQPFVAYDAKVFSLPLSYFRITSCFWVQIYTRRGAKSS